MPSRYYWTLVLAFTVISCGQTAREKTARPPGFHSFIDPPIKEADVPYASYTVDAAKGDTLFYPTGSILLFPPDAFADANGNIVAGKILIRYREFRTPLDFYLAGIPMTYDSAGKTYLLESSGMFEIQAYKDGLPLRVNPKSKPEINIVSGNGSPGHSVYLLDTAQKKWTNQAVSIVTELSVPINRTSDGTAPEEEPLIAPVKPRKAVNNSPVIRILIDSSSFNELKGYDNLRFQLEDNGADFDPKDTSEIWSNVELQKGDKPGLYAVRFSNAKKRVTYSARPVFAGNDYEAALKVFEKKNEAYNKRLQQRRKLAKRNKALWLRNSIENERVVHLNALIAARNRHVDSMNIVIDRINNETRDENQVTRLIRSLQIENFGYWNCDLATWIEGMPVVARFLDSAGNEIHLTNIAVIYRGFNGIMRFDNQHILVSKSSDNMIIGVYNGRFAYITYKEYRALGITPDTKVQIFKMNVVAPKDNNYKFIEKIESVR
jgi:hypothetical protein